MADPKSSKKTPEENPEGVIPEDPGMDFMGMLNSPIAKALLEGGADLFKKEKSDPNMCEIHIKGSPEFILKLFKIAD